MVKHPIKTKDLQQRDYRKPFIGKQKETVGFANTAKPTINGKITIEAKRIYLL